MVDRQRINLPIIYPQSIVSSIELLLTCIMICVHYKYGKNTSDAFLL